MGLSVQPGEVRPLSEMSGSDEVGGTAPRERPRILVAVEPRLLADAMATLLTDAGQDDVEVLPDGGVPEGHYDGAVVTLDLTGLDAEIVIRLPDDAGGAGTGTATISDEGRDVELLDVQSVLHLLDEHVSTAKPRAQVLRER
jgi:hypothetical protein